ncbi:MAG: hypothetical protein KGJ13_11625 [Patescibacteria group bacterium]|nr:hypothetical protein [Patescibacteria group bacterium]
MSPQAPSSWKVVARAHIPHGSGDAEWRIESEDGTVLVAVIDPEMEMVDPESVAHQIAASINEARVFG